jgi:hypothetical protein
MEEKKPRPKLAVTVAVLNGLMSMFALWYGFAEGHNLSTAITVLFFGGLAVHAYLRRNKPISIGYAGIG